MRENPAPRMSRNAKCQAHLAIIWADIDRVERNMPGTLAHYMSDEDKRKAPDYELVTDATLDPTYWYAADTFRRAGYVRPEQYNGDFGFGIYRHRVGYVARAYRAAQRRGELTTS